jgi:hemerythrin
MYVHWEKELELGNDLIDTQHRMMVLLCRKLDMAIKTGQPEQTISRVMNELKKFTEFHFTSEENLMHEMDYPDVHEHALMHADLLIQLEMMLAKIRLHKEFPDDLLYFLNKWLIQHVVTEDLKITEYSKIAKNRPIGEDLYGEYLLSVK